MLMGALMRNCFRRVTCACSGNAVELPALSGKISRPVIDTSRTLIGLISCGLFKDFIVVLRNFHSSWMC